MCKWPHVCIEPLVFVLSGQTVTLCISGGVFTVFLSTVYILERGESLNDSFNFSKKLIHSGTKQVCVFMSEWLDSYFNKFIQKHRFIHKWNKWVAVSETKYSHSTVLLFQYVLYSINVCCTNVIRMYYDILSHNNPSIFNHIFASITSKFEIFCSLSINMSSKNSMHNNYNRIKTSC